jgi:hypothetical protein
MNLQQALTALRRACATGRDAQTVTVRRGHLRALLEAYDASRRNCDTCRDADTDRCRLCVGCGMWRDRQSEESERRVPSDAVEVLAAACGAGGRREG